METLISHLVNCGQKKDSLVFMPKVSKVTDNMCFVKKIMIRYLILMPKQYENRLAHLINELYLTVKIVVAIYVVHY